MSLPPKEIVQRCIELCSERFDALVSTGVDEDVALDRTYDCYEKAVTSSAKHCFDSRDCLFEMKLRTVVQKG